MKKELCLEGASCRLYYDAPAWDGLKTAAIGDFACADATVGKALLEQACGHLAGEGFAAVLGPMNGDTWHSYRLVTDSDGSPAFPLEPAGGAEQRQAFSDAGFSPVSRYVSARGAIAAAIRPRRRSLPGIRVENWDGDFNRLVDDLYGLSLSTFSNNRFYKPISREAFRDLYLPLAPAIDPRLVFFARDQAGQLVAYLFAYPDRLIPGSVPTVVLKTYATAIRGAGQQLVDVFHAEAQRLGFVEVIHALMHEDNLSLARSRHHGAHIFRRYALMGRRLNPTTTP